MRSTRLTMRLPAVDVQSEPIRFLSRRAGGILAAALLAGCASSPASRIGDVPLGRRPGLVTVLITSSVRWEARPREEMIEPRVKAAVVACERSGGTECGQRAMPGEPRERFSREQNERVHVFVVVGDIEPGRLYECQTQWFGPDGGMAARVTKRALAPDPLHPSHTISFDIWGETRTMKPGRWRVEVSVNGNVETNRTFEIVTSASAQGWPLGLARQPS